MIDILSAYWKLAAKRYIDAVGMLITDAYTKPEQINDMKRKCHNALFEMSESQLEGLFLPDQHREQRRQHLETTSENMRLAKLRIAEGFIE